MKRKYPVIDTIRTGHNLRQIMLARGLTVKDIQSFLELAAPQGIYHWFEGKSMPTLDNIYALSELFCLPVDAMLKGNRKYVCPILHEAMCNRLTVYCEKVQQIDELCKRFDVDGANNKNIEEIKRR